MGNDKFNGFDPPKENWSKLPHQFINALPLIETESEMKVILYVLRHTWGFQEFDRLKRITLDEFQNGRKKANGSRMDKGTGLSANAIKDGIKRAIEHGFLIQVPDGRDFGSSSHTYQLTVSKSDTVSNSDTQPSDLDTQPSKSDTRSEKDTFEKKPREETLSADAEKAESPDDIVESIVEQARTHPDQFDLGRATEEVQAKAGNYADPLEDALIDTAIILFCDGRAPKKDSGTYRDMANVIGEVHTAYDLSSEEREGAIDAVRLAVRQFIAEKPKMAIYKYPSFAANYAQYLIRALNGEAEETHPQDDFDATWEEATRMTWERLHGNQQ